VSGTFATWQPEYAARGLPTFPLSTDDRKRPAVANYNRMGLRASRQLVSKWGDAEGLACMAGARNRLMVIDVDARGAEGERLLADIQAEIGPSRFIVRTGGGGFHAITSTPASGEGFGSIRGDRSICSAAAKSCCLPQWDPRRAMRSSGAS
jgi:hypothetical protein